MPVVSSSDSKQCAILVVVFLILFFGIFVLGVFFPIFMMMVVFATLGYHVHRDRQNRRGQEGSNHQNRHHGQGNAPEDAQQNDTELGIQSAESEIPFQMANTTQKQNYLKENLPLGVSFIVTDKKDKIRFIAPIFSHSCSPNCTFLFYELTACSENIET